MLNESGDDMDTYILAIESSCDETSMAVVKNGSEVIGTLESEKHTKPNKKGLEVSFVNGQIVLDRSSLVFS